MVSREAQCIFTGATSQKAYREPVDDRVVETVVKDVHSLGSYARLRAKYDSDISAMNGYHPVTEKGKEFFDRWNDGITLHSVGAWIRNPSGMLGDSVVNDIESLYLNHLRAYGRGNKAAWNNNYRNQVEAIESAYMSVAPQEMRDYASKYFDYHKRGGQLYASSKEGSNPFSRMVRNAVGNLIQWNPMIAALNGFEYLPKALAYAIEVAGPVNGPAAVMRAMTGVMRKTGGNPFKRIKELEEIGAYGFDPAGSRINFLNRSEDLLRNLSAELGTSLNRPPTEALERVAFVNRFGNEVQALWTRSGAETITLMRFAISANKMYLGLFGNIVDGVRTGNMEKALNGATSLAAFSAMTAIQTGGISAVPAPVAFVLKQSNPDLLESIQELDEEAPYLNLSKHLGLSFSDKVQPVGGFAIGVGYSIAQQDVMGGLKNLGRGAGNLVGGEPALGTAQLVDGLFGLGQVRSIPGVNLTTKRLVKSVAEELEHEGELTLEGFAKQAAIQTKLTEGE